MTNSRKKIKAQIKLIDETLHSQKKDLANQKMHFAESKTNRYQLIAFALLGAGFYVGWNAERKKLSKKMISPIAEIGTLIALNSVKKALISFLKPRQ